jgi:hypothetical protein
MVAGAGLRSREVLTAQVSALRGEAAGPVGEFECGASAALCWLLDGGPGPVTGKVTMRTRQLSYGVAGRPSTARAIVRELAAAEALIYGATTDRSDFARGVEHALMWAQFVTCSTPAGTAVGGRSGENVPGAR